MLKKIFIFSFLFIFFLSAFAEDEVKKEKKDKNKIPDPLYLNSEVLNPEDFEKPVKEKDPRTLEEKVRSKLHLPPTKKIYLHNIDKTDYPVTMDDYFKLSIEKKRKDFVIPEPVFSQPDDLILPDPQYRVIMYNTPPGQRNINLSQVIAQRAVSSPGILSPDKTKMVYTKAFYYPKFGQTSSAAYYVPVDSKINDAYQALYMTNVMQGDMRAIVEVGMDYLINYQFKSLYPIDWSKDSKKIAFKEKIGSNLEQTWQTNVIIYDFESQKWNRLTAVREAIIYWWRNNKNIDLKDYLWDIFPVGWDKNNPDRLVVYAYAFTETKPLFLGTWSIDFNEAKSQLVSIDSTQVEIDLNGFGLKEVKFEH